MSLPSPTELQLIALVADVERSGREVAKLFKQETGRTISYGTLYTTFRRLKESGWVKVRDDQDQDGRVRYFRIDIDGRRVLADGREFYSELAAFGLPQPNPMKDPAAVSLGQKAAGVPKKFTAAELARRRKRLAAARKKRWPREHTKTV